MNDFPAALAILNGKGASNNDLRQAIKTMRDEGHPLHIRVTWETGDAARFVQEAVTLGVATVIAGGGDGTINEVATALASLEIAHRPVLGILPLGTANDFATSAGIPQELDKALQLAMIGKPVDIDLVEVNKSAFFINMATGGFGTKITTETPEVLKAALGGISYVIHGLMRMDTLKADRCEIRGENFSWHGDALVMGIGNGRQAGGGQVLCPRALINDGLLELRIFTDEDFLPALFHNLMDSEDNPHIIDGQSPWFEITSPHDITFNLDGEPLKGRTFRLDVHHNALRCRLPPDCPLLK